MKESNRPAGPQARINCNIKGNAVGALIELKERGIVQNNREAVVQGLLALHEKVTKSDLEKTKVRNSTENRTYLRPWDEILGTLNGLETTDTDVVALLTCTIEKHTAITIQRDSPETEQLQQQLKELIGQKIALIRTDNPQKPYAIRTINQTKADKPIESTKQKQQCRNSILARNSGFAFCFAGVD